MSLDDYTEDQIAEFKEAFSLFDKDGDGKTRLFLEENAMSSIPDYPTYAMLHLVRGRV